MQLNDFQSEFKELMLDQPEACKNPSSAMKATLVAGKIPLHERLDVYRTNIVGSLSETLKNSFPLILGLVGEEFMDVLTRSYVMQRPPKSGYLHYYGDDFPAFLEDLNSAQSLPYLPDVARLETAMNRAYYAAYDDGLGAKDLAVISPEKLSELRLHIKSDVQLICSPYPLIALKEFIDKDGQSEPPNLNQGGMRYIMVSRPDTDVLITPLEASEHKLISSLNTGQTLGNALESLIQDHEDFNIQFFLEKHINLVTFKSLTTNVPI